MVNRKVSIAFLMALYQSDLNFLKRSLDSIIKQTYKGVINIYCILDGDNPYIFNFLDNYSKNNLVKERIIKIYKKKNSGTAETRNFGLNKISEDYVFIQDDDDFSLPERVDLALEEFNRDNKAVVIASSAIFKFPRVNAGEKYVLKNYPNNKIKILFSLICGINPICQPTICFKIKALCKKLGINKKDLYPKTITEDQSLWYFLAYKNIFVKQIRFPSVLYTIRPNQYSQNIFKESRVSSFYFVKEALKLLNSYKFMYTFLPLIIIIVIRRILIIKVYSFKLKILKK